MPADLPPLISQYLWWDGLAQVKELVINVMKLIKLLAHPVILIISFLIILISGQHVGGFYAMYLVMALPHGGVHAVLGIGGIVILLTSFLKAKSWNKNSIRLILNVAGLVCLWLSLFYFFYQDESGYNNGTLQQLLPILSIGLFALISFCFFIDSIVFGKRSDKGKLSFK